MINLQMRFFEIQMLIREKFPAGVRELILSFLKEPVVPWEPHDHWIPEYDNQGNYGHVPMCPIDLPMW